MSLGKITLDWCSIFDIFAIYEIKAYRLENGAKREAVLKSVENLWNEMDKQLGTQTLYKIYQSYQYRNLYETNREVWDSVDLAEIDKISAKQVADLNTKRFYYKNQLQLKFFHTSTTEQKAR